ncbi:metallophosphoesterase [Laceyella putida]|uniref:Metallophosphoesterase n=1 Tax=Laceyella putida TaxID=110101 RepID=A0ABW2RM51_9BACL
MKTETSVNRRTFIKRTIQYALGVFGSLGLSSFYSYWIEPHFIETKKVDIILPRLPESFRDFRICHFSDLHLGDHFKPGDLLSVAELIQSTNADVICFTGDLFDHQPVGVSKTIRCLSQLHAPFGKYAVLGNHDNWGNRWDVERVLRKADFRLLENKHVPLRKRGQEIFLAGVDDPWVGKPEIEQALQGIPENACTILLAHEPDFADEYAHYPVDLQLSGHSHGGQVCLPFVGPIYTPPHSQKYPSGLYQVNSDFQVYTTRGIGMTRFPIRFNCRPEITVITLKST